MARGGSIPPKQELRTGIPQKSSPPPVARFPQNRNYELGFLRNRATSRDGAFHAVIHFSGTVRVFSKKEDRGPRLQPAFVCRTLLPILERYILRFFSTHGTKIPVARG